MGAIRRAFKAYKEEALYFEAVFACHHDVDPVGIGIEVLNKFGTDSKYIQEVNFLCAIPPKELRNYETVAYKILFHSFSDGNVKLRWKKPREQLDEILFPKHVLCHQEVIRILNEAGGSLVSHSKKRNGCFDFEGGHNYAPISFEPGRAAEGYQKSLKTIVKLAQKIAGEDSNCAVQVKRRISWRILKDRDVVERTVLFCRHLDHQQLGKFAGYLTKSNINFFFPSKNTVVIEVSGIDASVLVQLMHYAEVPIPTTEIQGAFSVCIRGVETFARDHSLLDCRMSFGRIGTLSSFPLQIRCCDLGGPPYSTS